MCADQKRCDFCGLTGDRRTQWKAFSCPCGKIHYFCELCYEDFRDKGIIVRRGQRGGGKKEFLKGCLKEVKVAEALMREEKKAFKADWEAHYP